MAASFAEHIVRRRKADKSYSGLEELQRKLRSWEQDKKGKAVSNFEAKMVKLDREDVPGKVIGPP
ncbi:MAG: hypothetical protein OEY01_05440 [Desulfobulbaceae bacterium]|nr:hypothetical protein [Desulfobulbaceae bacterium]HIJ78552.1 hypothetical protein [Deltaproteobacteria bacterium]